MSEPMKPARSVPLERFAVGTNLEQGAVGLVLQEAPDSEPVELRLTPDQALWMAQAILAGTLKLREQDLKQSVM